MLDYEIREVLCCYIDTKNEKVRIMDEIVIGNARADIVTVTDCLTGYEIKSDKDSYIRLPAQIKAYDNYFQDNYIVVSKKFIKTAATKVPDYWGIIYVYSSEIEQKIIIIREPGFNPKFKIKKQLSLLWRNELTNIMVINKLPKYTRKRKSQVCDILIDRVSVDILTKQVCHELFERDWTKYM